jgi:hypothetical protein
MAPQAAKTPDQIKADSEARTRQMEDSEARIGADEDGIIERGATEEPNQNAGDDPLQGGVERRAPIQRSPQDDIRSQIAKRFRRTDDERPFNGDFSDPENSAGIVGQNDENDSDDDLADMGLSADEIARARGQAAQADDDDDDIDPQPRQRRQAVEEGDPAPKRRIKVNGQVLELTDEEILARASKVTAADAYLEEAKALLREAKAVRSGQPGRHAGENNGADTTDLGTDPPDDEARHNEPSTRSVIEKIQFGDPDEAAAELDRLVDSRAGKKATEGQLQRVLKQDLARSQKQLLEFTKANPELAGNELAALAIENAMYRGYREDIAALGLDEAQIPSDSKTLAEWHRYYRVNGYDVRPTKDLLEAGKKAFLTQIGQFGGKQSQQQRSSRQSQTRVNVNRDERRMNIPSQPTRSVAPRRDAQPTNRPQTGSDVVNSMRRQRGQPVG